MRASRGDDPRAGRSSATNLPAELSRPRIPARRYAVFPYRDHTATIRRTWATIWNRWLPDSGHEVADAPDFERYGAAFDS